MEQELSSQSLDHLGIVAGMIDHLKVVETIDRLIDQDSQMRHVSVGQSCKALILMGLGFSEPTLYRSTIFLLVFP